MDVTGEKNPFPLPVYVCRHASADSALDRPGKWVGSNQISDGGSNDIQSIISDER